MGTILNTLNEITRTYNEIVRAGASKDALLRRCICTVSRQLAPVQTTMFALSFVSLFLYPYHIVFCCSSTVLFLSKVANHVI